MKKILCALLAALLLFGGAFADGENGSSNAPTGSDSAEVTSEILRGDETAATVYYFTLNWSADYALYSKNQTYSWSPEALCYLPDEAQWVCVDNSAGVTMTVENRSNAAIVLRVEEITVPESAAYLVDSSSITGGSGSVRIASAAGEYAEQGTVQQGSLSVSLNTIHPNGETVSGGTFSEGTVTLGTVTFQIDAASGE